MVATIKKFYLARDISGLFTWMRRQAAGQDPRLMQIFQDRMINARNRLMARPICPENAVFSACSSARVIVFPECINLRVHRGQPH